MVSPLTNHDFCGKAFLKADGTHLKESQREEVEIGKLRKLLEQVQGNEREPVVLRGADLVVGEALLGVQTLVVDHEVPSVGSCDFLIGAVSPELRRV